MKPSRTFWVTLGVFLLLILSAALVISTLSEETRLKVVQESVAPIVFWAMMIGILYMYLLAFKYEYSKSDLGVKEESARNLVRRRAILAEQVNGIISPGEYDGHDIYSTVVIVLEDPEEAQEEVLVQTDLVQASEQVSQLLLEAFRLGTLNNYLEIKATIPSGGEILRREIGESWAPWRHVQINPNDQSLTDSGWEICRHVSVLNGVVVDHRPLLPSIKMRHRKFEDHPYAFHHEDGELRAVRVEVGRIEREVSVAYIVHQGQFSPLAERMAIRGDPWVTSYSAFVPDDVYSAGVRLGIFNQGK